MLGKIIQENRKRVGLSQEGLAEKINVSRQSVSKWEQDLAYPTIDNCIELCNVFDISMDELVGKITTPIKDTKKESNKLYKGLIFVLVLIILIMSFVYVRYPNVRVESYPYYINTCNETKKYFSVESSDIDIYKDEQGQVFVKVLFITREYSEEMFYDVIIKINNESIIQRAENISGKKYEVTFAIDYVDVIYIDIQRTYKDEILIDELSGFAVKDRFEKNYTFLASINNYYYPSFLQIQIVMPRYNFYAWEGIQEINYTIKLYKDGVLKSEDTVKEDIDEIRKRQNECEKEYWCFSSNGTTNIASFKPFVYAEIEKYEVEITVHEGAEEKTFYYPLSELFENDRMFDSRTETFR